MKEMDKVDVLVVVGIQSRDLRLETLADTDLSDDGLELAALLERACDNIS